MDKTAMTFSKALEAAVKKNMDDLKWKAWADMHQLPYPATQAERDEIVRAETGWVSVPQEQVDLAYSESQTKWVRVLE